MFDLILPPLHSPLSYSPLSPHHPPPLNPPSTSLSCYSHLLFYFLSPSACSSSFLSSLFSFLLIYLSQPFLRRRGVPLHLLFISRLSLFLSSVPRSLEKRVRGWVRFQFIEDLQEQKVCWGFLSMGMGSMPRAHEVVVRIGLELGSSHSWRVGNRSSSS
jgi:hypothetical protein